MAEILQIGLATSLPEFEELYRRIYGVREDVGVVTVNRTALKHMLYDHAQLIGLAQDDLKAKISIIDGDYDATNEALRAFDQYRSIDV